MCLYKYSIIIPFRDSLEQLAYAINSIPDRDDIQVIAVDNSKQLFSEDSYPKLNHATLVVASSKYGAGAGAARNEGIKHARGKWILFLDADDYFIKDAFSSFDRYSHSDYDIIFFKADSIKLMTGSKSQRHVMINQQIDRYLLDKCEDDLRYRFSNPVCKMLNRSLIIDNNITFDEIKCSNDVMFSTISGHYAKKITADSSVVYMITEAAPGGSLTADVSSENSFIRYQTALKQYAYMRSINRSDIRPRIASYIIFALIKFGPKEAMKYINYYYKQRLNK